MNINYSMIPSQQTNSVTKYELTSLDSSKCTRLADGTQIETNDEGSITQIAYPSGSSMRRHDAYVMVRAANSVYWFGDGKNWYQLD